MRRPPFRWVTPWPGAACTTSCRVAGGTRPESAFDRYRRVSLLSDPKRSYPARGGRDEGSNSRDFASGSLRVTPTSWSATIVNVPWCRPFDDHSRCAQSTPSRRERTMGSSRRRRVRALSSRPSKVSGSCGVRAASRRITNERDSSRDPPWSGSPDHGDLGVPAVRAGPGRRRDGQRREVRRVSESGVRALSHSSHSLVARASSDGPQGPRDYDHVHPRLRPGCSRPSLLEG